MELIIILVGILLIIFGLKMTLRKPNYEIEKTTNGRTVRFLGYDESRRHHRIKTIGKLILFFGVGLVGLGIYLFFILEQ